MDDSEREEEAEKSDEYSGCITLDDLKFVVELHTKFVQTFTKSEWLRCPKPNIASDFLTPFLQKFKIFKLLLDKFAECLSYKVDEEILGSLSVLSNFAYNLGDITSLSKLILIKFLLFNISSFI